MTTQPDFSALYQDLQTGIWRYLRFLGADPELAEDLTQEAFLIMLRKPPRQKDKAAITAWARTTARNLYLRECRRAQSRPQEISLADLDAVWSRYAAHDGGDEFVAALAQCLESLSGRAREALDFRYRDNISRRQIAKRMAMTEEGVKTLLRRAKETLKDCIERRVKHESGGRKND